jgi:hypothetical protein
VCEPVPRITTELSDRVVPDALTPSPTHRLANDAELAPSSVNLVAPVTSTVQVVSFCPPTVKLPVAPLLPHEPLLPSPLTDSTLPDTRGEENQTFGGGQRRSRGGADRPRPVPDAEVG